MITACLTAAGCENPISVSGTITFEGEPIPQGSIRFFPMPETPGDGASSVIADGAYSIPLDANLLPGKYLVQIYAEKETGRTLLSPEIIPIDEGGTGKQERYKELVQYIPQKYNGDSRLIIELSDHPNPENIEHFELEK